MPNRNGLCRAITLFAGIAAALPLYAFGQASSLPPAPAGVQVTTEYGIDFVTVAGNLGQTQSSFGDTVGATTPYRMARTEITTAQWLPFLNAAASVNADWLMEATPLRWGAVQSPGGTWVLNPDAPGAANQPVFGVTWRAAARLCNWLTNDAAANAAAFESGAYDTSTFGIDPRGTGMGFTDQIHHSDTARFWIPTLDEWITAAYSSLDSNGVQQWWLYPGQQNSPLLPGAPGVGQTSAGYDGEGAQFYIPVGAYPAGMSGWGMLDASGSVNEWVETPGASIDPESELPRFRRYVGTSAGFGPGAGDLMGGYGEAALFFNNAGIRIAAIVPAPGVGGLLFVLPLFMRRQKR